MPNQFPKHKKPGMSLTESGPHGAKVGNDDARAKRYGQAAIDRVMVPRDQVRLGDGRGRAEKPGPPETAEGLA